jgi:hypothetical protein
MLREEGRQLTTTSRPSVTPYFIAVAQVVGSFTTSTPPTTTSSVHCCGEQNRMVLREEGRQLTINSRPSVTA